MALSPADQQRLCAHLPAFERLAGLDVFAFDPDARVDAETLEAELADVGIELAPVHLAFDERFGGLKLQQDWGALTLGVHASLVAGGRPGDVGVRVVSGNLDLGYWLSDDGEVSFREMLSMTSPVRCAADPVAFVERFLRQCDPRLAHLGGASIQIRGFVGATLAQIADAQPLPSASDEIERLWENERVTIHEAPDWQLIIDPIGPDADPVDRTTIQAMDRAVLTDLLDAAREEIDELAWRDDDFSDWSVDEGS